VRRRRFEGGGNAALGYALQKITGEIVAIIAAFAETCQFKRTQRNVASLAESSFGAREAAPIINIGIVGLVMARILLFRIWIID